jgi:hypothetical protein
MEEIKSDIMESPKNIWAILSFIAKEWKYDSLMGNEYV